jgi:hypothetical protein
MNITTIDRKNFAASIGEIYTTIQSKPTQKFFVIPESTIQIDDDYDIKEYLQDIILRHQIEHDERFSNLSLQADILL